jgi:hypothetical protein
MASGPACLDPTLDKRPAAPWGNSRTCKHNRDGKTCTRSRRGQVVVRAVRAVDRERGNAVHLCVSVFVEYFFSKARENTRPLWPNLLTLRSTTETGTKSEL